MIVEDSLAFFKEKKKFSSSEEIKCQLAECQRNNLSQNQTSASVCFLGTNNNSKCGSQSFLPITQTFIKFSLPSYNQYKNILGGKY